MANKNQYSPTSIFSFVTKYTSFSGDAESQGLTSNIRIEVNTEIIESPYNPTWICTKEGDQVDPCKARGASSCPKTCTASDVIDTDKTALVKSRITDGVNILKSLFSVKSTCENITIQTSNIGFPVNQL